MSPGNLNGVLCQGKVKKKFCERIWRKVKEDH